MSSLTGTKSLLSRMLCESPTSELILPGPRGLLPRGLQFYHRRYSSVELDLQKPLNSEAESMLLIDWVKIFFSFLSSLYVFNF